MPYKTRKHLKFFVNWMRITNNKSASWNHNAGSIIKKKLGQSFVGHTMFIRVCMQIMNTDR